MRNWQVDAPRMIAAIMAELPVDATVAQRRAALRKRTGDFHLGTSWGKKVWSKHCRRYLAQFEPTARKPSPLFADDIIFPFREPAK